MDLQLKERVYLVTGGARGLGRATADALVADGARVVLSGRGAVFERYDQPGLATDERGVFDAGRFRAAWLRDPDGNTLAITAVTLP